MRSRPCTESADTDLNSMSYVTSFPRRAQVLVTGAGGRTGRLAFEQIAARSNEFNARALVRCGDGKLLSPDTTVATTMLSPTPTARRTPRRTEESKKALSGVNGEVFVARGPPRSSTRKKALSSVTDSH